MRGRPQKKRESTDMAVDERRHPRALTMMDKGPGRLGVDRRILNDQNDWSCGGNGGNGGTHRRMREPPKCG
ncbi:uncharacterized protein CLUP02_05338 [Colletotrichum lupini]|uniref:Uncharacterized protein n=2 Tax=Colletotrichum acutatum species complex TaxID=2707335 RepID=A0A9Q8SMB1_9PEZI|nr:uncharacterized protein CLUP02_05338 [Colletotrichum lupini]XP_060316723.1 uncharacterized protein CCOS01_04584 [Colletotrichum costaricense]KAK1532601.1 hypothetical protein CCOS01_04584 [Colletotrichum costaricense]UQC79858.1 hypothetical protein CLUP02_05338 [Colletotrichum lupini]